MPSLVDKSDDVATGWEEILIADEMRLFDPSSGQPPDLLGDLELHWPAHSRGMRPLFEHKMRFSVFDPATARQDADDS